MLSILLMKNMTSLLLFGNMSHIDIFKLLKTHSNENPIFNIFLQHFLMVEYINKEKQMLGILVRAVS